MSVELLKRALDELLGQENGASINELVQDIETYLAQPEPEPVAWIEVGHPMDGPYNCHFMAILPKGKHHVYLKQPDQSARLAELTQHLKDAHAENAGFCQIIERQTKQLAALQANREPLSDDEIRDCAESENLPYFENKEEFNAFARAIETAHGIGTNHE